MGFGIRVIDSNQDLLTYMTLAVLLDHYDCFSIYKTGVIIYVAELLKLDEWYDVCKVPTILTGQSIVEAK